VIALAAGMLVPTLASAAVGDDLQAVLARVVAEHALVPGALAYVDAPRAGLPWKGAAGNFAFLGARPLSPDDPFRIASTQKPFTAAAILRLVEDHRLSLDDKIAPYLPPDLVHKIHVFQGVDYGPQITIRHLLGHTSGLNSHDECNSFLVKVGTRPRHYWTPREEIEEMIRCGDPLFRPGTGFHYSDTGYVMLGLVLSRITGKSYAGALRDLLPIDALGLDRTWHELLEPAPPGSGPRAHQYFAAVDLTGWNPSFDSWGGGGYVSTGRDLARFIRALFEGRVFKRAETLSLMKRRTAIRPGSQGHGTDGYGLGLTHFVIAGVECWGHPGFWSSVMLYCPALDLALGATTNQASDAHFEHTQDYVYGGVIPIVKGQRPVELRLKVRPRRVRARKRSRAVRFLVKAGGRPLGGAAIRLRGHSATTDASGRARLRIRFERAHVYRPRACKEGVGCVRGRLKVRPRA
jgi:D-alanyl-D-alanine carboxypeptidase